MITTQYFGLHWALRDINQKRKQDPKSICIQLLLSKISRYRPKERNIVILEKNSLVY